jgi:hypothetical protein
VRKHIIIAALAVLTAVRAGAAQDASRPMGVNSPNQRMANAVAAYLQASGQFRGCQLDVAFMDGLAELSGQVRDLGQKAEAVRIARTIPGVFAVRDLLTVAGVMPQVLTPGPMPGGPVDPNFVLPAQAFGPAPKPGPAPEVPGSTLPEPLSLMPMPLAPNPAYNPPPMPPYAWPTYAPYNNLSRVAYPTLYPYEAWPFIGPMYPFPKVPPGWRAVTLRWQDGHWWYGKEATGHDWWRVRYW